MDRRHHVCGQEDSDEASTPGAGVAMIGVAMEFLVAEVNLDLIVIISFLDILEMMLKSNLIFHQQKSVLFCGGLPFFFGGGSYLDYLRRRFLSSRHFARLHPVDPRGLGDAEERDGSRIDDRPERTRRSWRWMVFWFREFFLFSVGDF